MADAFLTTAKDLIRREEQSGDAQAAAEQALNLSRKAKDSEGVAEALRCLVALKVAAEDKAGALELVRDEVAAVVKAKDKLAEGMLLTVQAEVMLTMEDYTEALSLGLAARGIFQQLGNAAQEATTLSKVIVNVRCICGDKAEAIRNANEALALAGQCEDKKVMACAWLAALNAHLVNESREALQAGRRGLELCREIGDKEQEGSHLHALASAHLTFMSPTEAANGAAEAMNMFKAMGFKKMVGAAFSTLVQALITDQQPKEAVKRAEQELALCQKVKDKRTESHLVPAVIKAHVASGASDVAARKARISLRLFQDLADRKGEADMLKTLAELQYQAAQHQEADLSANSALTIYQALKDKKGEEGVLFVLDHIYVAKGEADSAPHRAEALSLLREMARSLEDRNGEEFKDIVKRFNAVGGVTQEDVDEIFTPVLQKDETSARTFIRKYTGTDLFGSPAENGAGGQSGMQIGCVVHKNFYAGFRYGGLGYGPRFRCVKMPTARKGVGEAVAVMRVSSEAEVWEAEMLTHPGLLDGTLQTGAANSHVG